MNPDLNIEMNFMPAADSRVFMFGHVDVYEIEDRFEYRNEFHASSRFAFFFFFFMYGHVDVYEIEYRFEYRNEFHASSRFACFHVLACGCL